MRYSKILVPFLLVLGACTPSRYAAFRDRQVWPTAPGAVSDTLAALPVYRSWPDKPYRVIGAIEFAGDKSSTGAAHIAEAADVARNKGGDAMILRYPGEFELGNNPSIPTHSSNFSPDKATMLIVKWKSQSEIIDEQRRRDAFQKRFRDKHPSLEVSDDLLGMALDYGAFLGLDPDLPAQSAQLEADLVEIVAVSAHSTSSYWLYRGTLHVTTPTTSFTDTVYGIATLTKNGEALNLASKSANAELSFTGVMDQGHLNGELVLSGGLASSTSRAEGVVMPGRISLDSRGQSSEEVVRGSFVFLH
jgi:hypothetical protein